MKEKGDFDGDSQPPGEGALDASGAPRTPPSGVTATEALAQEVLVHLPTDIARLFFLVSMVDRANGRYIDPGRSARFGAEAVHNAALAAHLRLFESLTNAPVKELAEQLANWAATESEGFLAVAQDWRNRQTYASLAPPTALQSDAAIFEKNVKLAMEMVAETKSRTNRKQSGSRRTS